MVQLLDIDPSGATSLLQRGLQRASFRPVDAARSDRVAAGPHAGEIYRPHHPFTAPANLTVGIPVEVLVEIYPVGFVLRPGHRLVVSLQTPSAVDELNVYDSAQPPAVDTIWADAAHPTSILVPVLGALPRVPAATPACGTVTGVPCTTPATGAS
jgi:hypothetical protein